MTERPRTDDSIENLSMEQVNDRLKKLDELVRAFEPKIRELKERKEELIREIEPHRMITLSLSSESFKFKSELSGYDYLNIPVVHLESRYRGRIIWDIPWNEMVGLAKWVMENAPKVGVKIND